MLCVIIISFIGGIVILHLTKGEEEPISILLNENEWLGWLGTHGQYIVRLLISPWLPWALGPSSETLLGFLLFIFFFLLFLLVGAQYLRILFFVFTVVISFVFYQIYGILKVQYTVENTVEIFNRWGLRLRKNNEASKIDELIDRISQLYEAILKGKDVQYEFCAFDKTQLRKDALAQNFSTPQELEEFLQQRITSQYRLLDTKTYGPSSFTSGLVDFISNYWWQGLLVLGVGVGIVYLLYMGGYLDNLLEYAKGIRGVQDTQTDFIVLTDLKTDVAVGATMATQDNLKDLVANTITPHAHVTQIALTNDLRLQKQLDSLAQLIDSQQNQLDIIKKTLKETSNVHCHRINNIEDLIIVLCDNWVTSDSVPVEVLKQAMQATRELSSGERWDKLVEKLLQGKN